MDWPVRCGLSTFPAFSVSQHLRGLNTLCLLGKTQQLEDGD